MPADIPDRDLHRYAHYQALMADASASPNEKATAGKLAAKLERAWPGIAGKTKAAQKADPERFLASVWRVFKEGAAIAFEEALKADAAAAAAAAAAGESPAGGKREKRERPPGHAPAGTTVPGIGGMSGHFRANNDKHLCVLTITIRGVDADTPIHDGAAFAASIAECARGTVAEWLATDDAAPAGK